MSDGIVDRFFRFWSKSLSKVFSPKQLKFCEEFRRYKSENIKVKTLSDNSSRDNRLPDKTNTLQLQHPTPAEI